MRPRQITSATPTGWRMLVLMCVCFAVYWPLNAVLTADAPDEQRLVE
jgi:hypothetical protein